jgi:hypothetical protein
MSAHLYVHADVFSDCAFYGMSFYTHHKYKGAHHYVGVDVISACSFA